jgi:hypothetical protein
MIAKMIIVPPKPWGPVSISILPDMYGPVETYKVPGSPFRDRVVLFYDVPIEPDTELLRVGLLTVNNSHFLGIAPGCLLFTGFNGTKNNETRLWDISTRFCESFNESFNRDHQVYGTTDFNEHFTRLIGGE